MNPLKPLSLPGVAAIATSFCYIAASDLCAEQQVNGTQNGLKLRPKAPIHERVDFLEERGQLLMIPKKSLIYVPDWLQDKVITDGKTKGKIVRLDKFIAANGNWLTTHQVSFDLALGKNQFTQEELEHLKAQNKIVIATHGKTPIGVSAKAWTSPKHNNAGEQ